MVTLQVPTDDYIVTEHLHEKVPSDITVPTSYVGKMEIHSHMRDLPLAQECA